jgi:hypothetical protein
MWRTLTSVVVVLATGVLPAAGQDTLQQTERVSRRIPIGRDGHFSLTNIAGEIVIASGAGDDVVLQAVKRTNGDRRELSLVDIDIDARPGRVDVETRHSFGNRFRDHQVAVDYNVQLPAGTTVDVRSVSGTIKVSGITGAVRAETVSGSISATGTPRLEQAKSVSGDVEVNDVSGAGDVRVGSVSGRLRARGLRGRSLDLGTVSGDLTLSDVSLDRLGVRSVSGNVGYTGRLTKAGRFEFNSHSGTVRLALSDAVGFDLTAGTFSGAIRSQLPLKFSSDGSDVNVPPPPPAPPAAPGQSAAPAPPAPPAPPALGAPFGRRGLNRSIRGTLGDGSAVVIVHTFSGDIVIEKAP